MKGKRYLIVILVIVIAYLFNEIVNRSKSKSPVVTIAQGKVQGVMSVTRDGRDYYEYLGLPYAKPPIRELRYEPPQSAEKWEGVRDASRFGHKCPQLDLLFAAPDGNEDCLFLNVATPAKRDKLLPVMIFFHGGIFFFGSSNGYRADYLLDEDVVLVTVNYRLGSFGFLNTGDGIVKGNMGLKDQTAALRWVQENIAAFGGDKTRVTIFGESAGAASTQFHMISPMSKGLFSRAISQSGTALSPWAIWPDPKAQALRFAKKLGCPTDDTKRMVDCMKNLSMQEIMTAHQEVLVPLRDMITVFVPTLESGKVDENTFLAEYPADLIKSGRYYKVPHLVGANAQDGLIFSSAVMRNDTVRDIVYNDLESVMSNIIFTKPKGDAAKKIKEFYMPTKPQMSDLPSFRKFTDMFTDNSFFNGIHDTALYQAAHSPVYLYHYEYKGEFRAANLLVAIKRKYPIILEFSVYLVKTLFTKYVLRQEAPFYGVGHIDELALLFHLPWISNVKKHHKDYKMSKHMVKLWTDYAYGRPLELLNVPWKPIDVKESLKYLNISLNPAVIDDPFVERYNFWKNL